MRSSPLTSQTSSTSGARQFGCAAAGYEASVITDRIAKPWVSEPPYARGERWPEREDVFLSGGLGAEAVDRWVQSAAVLPGWRSGAG